MTSCIGTSQSFEYGIALEVNKLLLYRLLYNKMDIFFLFMNSESHCIISVLNRQMITSGSVTRLAILLLAF